MDRNTENFILKILGKIKSDCAVLFISHRLQNLPKIADTIYVLEKGTIQASGNHDQLLESINFYSEYWL